MFCYTAYGLGIRSDVVLPELGKPVTAIVSGPPAPARRAVNKPADIVIRIGAVDRVRPESAAGDGQTWVCRDEACFHYSGTGTFRVTQGREVVVEPAAGAQDGELRLILLGPVLAVLLHQRGLLVLHASAVALTRSGVRQAVGFMGDKGAGKSTTAAALHARGHALIADDLVAIDLAGPVPQVWPGFPHLKLWPEAAASTLDDHDTVASLARVHPQFEKRSRPIAGEFHRERVPLAALYVLTDAGYEAAEPAAAREAFFQLVRHSYLARILHMTRATAAHFQQVTQVARTVPVRNLMRRRDLAGLPALAQLIEIDAMMPETTLETASHRQQLAQAK
jgi:hypothetical protein